MTELIQFHTDNGQTIALNPASVAAVVGDYHHPGGRYDSGCTVHLLTGSQIRMPYSAFDVLQRLGKVEV